MAARPLSTHVDAVTPEAMSEADGWLISEFRLPFGAPQGLGTTMFHARFRPGAVHKKHKHTACEEIYYLVAGRGIAGAGGATEEVRAGHFHYVPADTEHWLVNATEDRPIEVVGWYLGAGTVAETGYVYLGDVTAADRDAPRRGYTVGALTHADAAACAAADPALRIGLGAGQGIAHRAWRRTVDAGETVGPRIAAADTYLFVLAGRGRVMMGDEAVTIRPGSCLYVPAGTSQGLQADGDDAVVVVGLEERAAAD